nr:MAG TPA: hypothetical protein [Caudoviricetes sp.]
MHYRYLQKCIICKPNFIRLRIAGCVVLRFLRFTVQWVHRQAYTSQRVQSTSIKRQPVQGTDALKQSQTLTVP